jgi:adenylate cyclase
VQEQVLPVERELAIFFLDIRNYTRLLESQPQVKVITVVKRLFKLFNQIIKNFGGKVVELAGDNIYAVFGLTSNVKEAANNAYSAIQSIFDNVRVFNDVYADAFFETMLEIGVGLHTGKVYVDETGIDSVPQLSVMGLPVNIAARLQSATKELNNDFVLSEEVYGLLNLGEIEMAAIPLRGVSDAQNVRLAGQPYLSRLLGKPDLGYDYLLAISG